jgi:hypothetical protein
MRFNRITRIAAAVAVIGAVAAGGAAFTAGTGQPTTQAVGYGATSVTGGDITGITYQLNSAGDTITTVTLTTGEDLTKANNNSPATVLLAFNGDGFASGGDAACVVQSSTTVVCTPNSSTTVASVTSEQIAITDANTGDTFSGT